MMLDRTQRRLALVFLISLGLAGTIIGAKLYLIGLMRWKLGQRFSKDDWMFWTDFVMAGIAGGIGLMLTTNDSPESQISDPKMLINLGLLAFGAGPLPLIASFAYGTDGKPKNWLMVTLLNILGYLVMLSALSLGAKINV